MLNFKQQDYGTDCAWDIVTGCSKCAPACKHCHILRCKTKYPEVKFYAEKLESPLYAVHRRGCSKTVLRGKNLFETLCSRHGQLNKSYESNFCAEN